MKQGRLLTSVATAATAIAFTLGATGALAGEKVTWNFSTWGKPRAFTAGIEALRDYVAEKSAGNFTIKVHYGGAISPPKENLDGIRIGSHEAANFCTSYHPGKNPAGTVLDLPFLPLANLDVQAAVHESFYEQPVFKKELARWNAKPIFSGILPQYEFMGVGDPPKKLADWKGMRVRALGGIGAAMKKLGAVPTTVPAPETYTALERGITQAISFPYSYTFGAYRLHEIGKWFTEGMTLGSVNCPIAMNIPAYNALPAEYRMILDSAAPNSYAALKAAYKEADKKWIPIYHKRMQVIKYSKAQRDEFIKIGAGPVWDDWVKKMSSKVPAQELLDFILAEAAKFNKKYGS
jgi:TRAP-type mannitol/chloroaromatic compound transport system substrate-binding protein